jgi:hypothetical protein
LSKVRKREGSAHTNAFCREDIEKELKSTCQQFDFSLRVSDREREGARVRAMNSGLRNSSLS